MNLRSTGSNSNGQLSNSTLSDSSLFLLTQFNTSTLPKTILDLKFGGTHTLALVQSTEGGEKKEVCVVGCNQKGQLGLPITTTKSIDSQNNNNNNYTTFQSLPLELLLSSLIQSGQLPLSEGLEEEWRIDSIATTWESSFILLKNNNNNRNDLLLSFGGNDWGELGMGVQGSKTSDGHPTFGKVWKVPLDHLLPSSSNSYQIDSIHSGPRHILLLVTLYPTYASSDQAKQILIGWGISRQGQLSCLLSEKKVVLLPTLIPLDDAGMRVTDIKVGRDHTVLLLNGIQEGEEKVIVWGRLKSLSSSSSCSTTTFDIESFPLLSTASLDKILFKRKIQSIHSTWSGIYVLLTNTTSSSSSSLLPSTSIYALGSNTHGQLAQSSSISFSSSNIPITLPSDLEILDFSTGSEHLLTLCYSSTSLRKEIWAWGWNEHGNLGNGNLEDCWIPTLVWTQGEKEEEKKKIKVWGGNGTSWIFEED